MNSKRSVIVHYHTFKNSGTSFDELLTANYKDNHLCFDGPFPYTMFNQQELLKVIRRSPTKIAFSSHSIRLPVPTDLDVNAVAALFIRHPLLRIRSVYGFEMRSEGIKAKLQTAVKSKLFKKKAIPQEATATADQQPTFDEWVTYLRGHTASNLNAGLLSNSQTHMFCGVYGTAGIAKTFFADGPKAVRLSDLDQAKRNLLAVPLLARTETFEQDVKRFPEILSRYGIEFNYQDFPAANVSNPNADGSVKDRLQHVEEELSEDNLTWLSYANAQDLELYNFSTEILT
jgi:hypothetical protein